MNSLENREQGGVFILFTLTILLLVGLMALAVDSTLFGASKAQHRQTAEFTVLRALKVYGTELAANGNTAATRRAALITALGIIRDPADVRNTIVPNMNTNAAHNFFQSAAENDVGMPGSPGANGELVPIRWYYPLESGAVCTIVELTARDGCPCDEACAVRGDNLIPPVNPADDIKATGLMLDYTTNAGSPIKAFLGQVFGNVQTFRFESKVYATLVPRNGIFLLDLSGSIVSDTFAAGFPSDPTVCTQPVGGLRHVFQRKLPGGGFCPTPIPSIPGISTMQTAFEEDNWDSCIVGGSGAVQAQYQCIEPTLQTFNGTSVQQTFWVHDDPVSLRPEPLASALDGILAAMLGIEARQVGGDTIGVIGFDNEMLRNRILSGAGTDFTQPAYSQIYTAAVGSAEFNSFKSSVDTTLSITNPLRGDRVLFPRENQVGNPTTSPGTDIALALRLARAMIRNTPTFAQAQNFIVLFSDGLPNCSPTTPGDCRGAPGPGANNTMLNYFVNSLGDTVSPDPNSVIGTLPNLITDKIAFHTFLLGGAVQPHQLAHAGQNGCATEAELRASGLPVTDPGISDLTSFRTVPFNRPNMFAQFAAQTGGIWAPIRPCHRVAGVCTPFPTGGPTGFDTLCAGLTGMTPNYAAGAAQGYWDSQGRIFKDPQGRSTSQQVQDYINEIISVSPYRLVQPSVP